MTHSLVLYLLYPASNASAVALDSPSVARWAAPVTCVVISTETADGHGALLLASIQPGPWVLAYYQFNSSDAQHLVNIESFGPGQRNGKMRNSPLASHLSWSASYSTQLECIPWP